MKRLAMVLATLSLLTLGATTEVRCNIPDIFFSVPLNVVTVEYVNDADADVAVSLLFHPEDDEDEDDLEDEGDQIDTLVPVGQIKQIVLDCDEAGSLMIDRAKLLVVGDIGPTVGTDALHRGDAFGCGDTLTFTFYNSPTLTELHVEIDVSY